MADSNLLAGVATVTIDGTPYWIVGEGTYATSSFKRTTLMGMDGYHGYSEEPAPGKMSWKGRNASSLSVAALNAMASATVVFSLANGKVIIGRSMTRVGDPIEVSTDDATFTADFEGPDVSEN
jgi:hypothetical protein